MAGHQAPPSLGFSRQEYWSGLPFPSPMHESEKWKWSRSVVSDSLRPHGLQPTRILCPWDFPGKSTCSSHDNINQVSSYFTFLPPSLPPSLYPLPTLERTDTLLGILGPGLEPQWESSSQSFLPVPTVDIHPRACGGRRVTFEGSQTCLFVL